MRKCYANANMLLRKFVECSPDVKCYLFKTYCCNLYCATFWYDSINPIRSGGGGFPSEFLPSRI